MRRPLICPPTCRRERRILTVLRVRGALTDAEIAEAIGTYQWRLRAPLLNLAEAGMITTAKRPGYLRDVMAWTLVDQEASDGQ